MNSKFSSTSDKVEKLSDRVETLYEDYEQSAYQYDYGYMYEPEGQDKDSFQPDGNSLPYKGCIVATIQAEFQRNNSISCSCSIDLISFRSSHSHWHKCYK